MRKARIPMLRRLHATIVCALVASLGVLAASARQQATTREAPPVEQGVFRDADLVELVRLDPTIHLDIRYATPNNLTGRAVYPEARAFLQRPAAEALVRVSAALKQAGYGLAVFDAYRPWSITKVVWDVTPADKKKFVADPAVGSKHNRGCAVDLTLYELATGREVTMPSEFDEMTDRSAADYPGGPADRRATREVLRKAMEAEGFTVYPDEWWHFDYRDWRSYRIQNVGFGEIR
jgi:zinc D-Ala-D-Ala dipeptidase